MLAGCLCTGVVRVFAPADIDAEEGEKEPEELVAKSSKRGIDESAVGRRQEAHVPVVHNQVDRVETLLGATCADD